jgi:hypothetical protein
MEVTVVGFQKECCVPLAGLASLGAFEGAVRQALALGPSDAIVFTDTHRREVTSARFEAEVLASELTHLFALPSLEASLGMVFTEDIDYQPHYSTLQSGNHHFAVLAHAFAEFIDNSVESTGNNSKRGLDRDIQVHLFRGEQSDEQYVCFRDNGGGMDKSGVRSFATYVLTPGTSTSTRRFALHAAPAADPDPVASRTLAGILRGGRSAGSRPRSRAAPGGGPAPCSASSLSSASAPSRPPSSSRASCAS